MERLAYNDDETLLAAEVKVGGAFPTLILGRVRGFMAHDVELGITDYIRIGRRVRHGHRSVVLAWKLYFRNHQFLIRDDEDDLIEMRKWRRALPIAHDRRPVPEIRSFLPFQIQRRRRRP